MMSNTAPISLSPFMLEPAPYDPIKAFTHVAYVGSVPNVFVVHPSVPAKTIPEFIAWAKQQKDPIPYGSGGVGSIGHIVGELFAKEAGIRLDARRVQGQLADAQRPAGRHDPVRDRHAAAERAVPEVRQAAPARGHVHRSARRWRPTCRPSSSSGYPKLVAENFFGISGPAGLPKPVVDSLHKATMAALDDPKLLKNFDDLGIAVAQDVARGVHRLRAEAGERVGAGGEGVGRQAQLSALLKIFG